MRVTSAEIDWTWICTRPSACNAAAVSAGISSTSRWSLFMYIYAMSLHLLYLAVHRECKANSSRSCAQQLCAQLLYPFGLDMQMWWRRNWWLNVLQTRWLLMIIGGSFVPMVTSCNCILAWLGRTLTVNQDQQVFRRDACWTWVSTNMLWVQVKFMKG